MIFNVGFSDIQKLYFLWNKENIFCFLCRKKVTDYFVLRTEFDRLRKEISQTSYCPNCDDATKNSLKHGSRTLVRLEKRPKDCIPVIPDTLIPSGGNPVGHITGGTVLSHDDIEADKKAGVRYIDHTRLANKESIEGAQIGVMPTARLQELDKKLLTDKQGLDLLDDLGSAELAEPALEYQERKSKVLEDKSCATK